MVLLICILIYPYSTRLICLLQLNFKQDVKCKKVCPKTYKKGNQEDATKLDFLKMGMQLNYQHHWLVKKTAVLYSCMDLTQGYDMSLTLFIKKLIDVNQLFFQDH